MGMGLLTIRLYASRRRSLPRPETLGAPAENGAGGFLARGGVSPALLRSYGAVMDWVWSLLVVVLLLVLVFAAFRWLYMAVTKPPPAPPVKTPPIVRRTTPTPPKTAPRVIPIDTRPRSRERVTVVEIDGLLERVDLRDLPASRFRIVGTAFWVKDRDREVYGGPEYQLVREPENKHDSNAVAVYGRGRKVGYLSTAKAAGVGPELDRLGMAAYTVSGAGSSDASSRLWVDVPLLSGLRRHRA